MYVRVCGIWKSQIEKTQEIPGLPARDPKIYVIWSRLLGAGMRKNYRIALFTPELGRFGNMTRRLVRAMHASLASNFSGVVVPNDVIFSERWFHPGAGEVVGGNFLWLGADSEFRRSSVPILVVADFFYGESPQQTLSLEKAEVAWLHLRSRLKISVPKKSTGPKILTIHVRGGDVFGPRTPSSYGQPPLSFYALVIDSQEWEKVTVVHQDMSNPTLQGILDHCASSEIPVATHCGTDTQDVSALLSAEHIVAGRGTFIPAVAGLSPFCRSVYFFEDKCAIEPPRESITMFRVADFIGEYRESVLSGNWKNSKEQRDLMVEYPVSSLRMETK